MLCIRIPNTASHQKCPRVSKSACGGEDLLQIQTRHFAGYVHGNAKVKENITVCKNDQIRASRNICGQIIGDAVGCAVIIGTVLVFYKNALKCGSVEIFNHQKTVHRARVACPIVRFGCRITVNINELALQAYKMSNNRVVDVLRILITEIFIDFIVANGFACRERLANPFRPSFAVVIAETILTVVGSIVLRLKFFYFFANGALGIQIVLQPFFGNTRTGGGHNQFLLYQNLVLRIFFFGIYNFISGDLKQAQLFAACCKSGIDSAKLCLENNGVSNFNRALCATAQITAGYRNIKSFSNSSPCKTVGVDLVVKSKLYIVVFIAVFAFFIGHANFNGFFYRSQKALGTIYTRVVITHNVLTCGRPLGLCTFGTSLGRDASCIHPFVRAFCGSRFLGGSSYCFSNHSSRCRLWLCGFFCFLFGCCVI